MNKKHKQFAALLGVILLVGLAIASLVFACLDFPGSYNLFRGCLISAVFMPILIWIYIWIYGKFTSKHTLASVWDETPEMLDDSDQSDFSNMDKDSDK